MQGAAELHIIFVTLLLSNCYGNDTVRGTSLQAVNEESQFLLAKKPKTRECNHGWQQRKYKQFRRTDTLTSKAASKDGKSGRVWSVGHRDSLFAWRAVSPSGHFDWRNLKTRRISGMRFEHRSCQAKNHFNEHLWEIGAGASS